MGYQLHLVFDVFVFREIAQKISSDEIFLRKYLTVIIRFLTMKQGILHSGGSQSGRMFISPLEHYQKKSTCCSEIMIAIKNFL
jgi:hypothetical protein